MLQIVDLRSFLCEQLMHPCVTMLMGRQYARCTGDAGYREDGARHKGRVGRRDVCAAKCIGQHPVLSSHADRAKRRRWNDCNTCKLGACFRVCVERTVLPAANPSFNSEHTLPSSAASAITLQVLCLLLSWSLILVAQYPSSSAAKA